MRKIYPILCNYYITTKCNARCKFCDIFTKPGKHANNDDIFINLKDLKRLGITFIDFTGGEPLMHPRLPEILQAAKKMGFRTTITTNCLLYPEKAESLTGLIDLLHFSLDASAKEKHDSIRGVPAFDKVMESIDLATELGEKPDLLFTVTDQSIGDLDILVRFAQTMRLILLVNPVFDYFESYSIQQETLQRVLSVKSEPFVYINRGIVQFMLDGGNQIHTPRCKAMTTTVVISPENELLLPCYHHHNTKVPIQGKLYDLYKSQQMKINRCQEGRYLFCRNCTISCYFDPSFTYGLDKYFFLSQLSKIKYAWDKYLRIF